MTRFPDEFGSGFQGTLLLPSGDRVVVEVLSNFERVPESDLTESISVENLKRITVRRYLMDKVQCLVERVEARDLADVAAVIRVRPELAAFARSLVQSQDILLLTERLLSWDEEAVRKDARAYEDVDPQEVLRMRDELLRWIRKDGSP